MSLSNLNEGMFSGHESEVILERNSKSFLKVISRRCLLVIWYFDHCAATLKCNATDQDMIHHHIKVYRHRT